MNNLPDTLYLPLKVALPNKSYIELTNYLFFAGPEICPDRWQAANSTGSTEFVVKKMLSQFRSTNMQGYYVYICIYKEENLT